MRLASKKLDNFATVKVKTSIRHTLCIYFTNNMKCTYLENVNSDFKNISLPICNIKFNH